VPGARTADVDQLRGGDPNGSRPTAVPDSILTKYGQPYREVKAASALWCNKGMSLGSGPLACAPDVPNLQLKGSELILSDSGPFHRERAAWNTKTTGAPPI